ncbi:hypothetical protein Tco_0706634 [Tanacetum coccineum]|uniref:Uncharacterized protein n=1 Tax=Tanacetum coccineum TaxID=301880 RepID=A0ABQ4Y9I3_9ASTR
MKRGYAGDIVPLLPAMLARADVDQGNTLGSVKDSMQLQEFIVLVPILVTRINSLEKELKETKQTLGNAMVKLVKKDQGRKIQDIDDDPLVSLVRESMKEKSTYFVTPTKASGEAQEEEISPTILEAAKTLSKIDTGLDAEEEINTGREEINTGIEEVSTGSTKVDSSTASKRGQREGKAPMVEEDIQLKKLKFEEIKEEFDKRKMLKYKEEEPVKRTGKRKKQKARKGYNVDKGAQDRFRYMIKEESVEAMNLLL